MTPAAALRRRHLTDRAGLERIEAQCRFADGLGADGKILAQQARERASAVLAGGDVAAAVAAAEAVLDPLAATAKTFTVHAVGHAHIDMNWMWGWHETVAITCDTVRTVLKLMDEFPAFRFGQSQASVYRILEQHAPDLLHGVRAKIAAGQWEVLAAHWVEGDRNVPSGEGIVRQLVETRSYVAQLLGLSPADVPVDWSPDTFGHAASIPAISVGGGTPYLYCCRTGTTDRPAVFWWRGPDGSRVLVNREIAWYQESWYAGMPMPSAIAKHALDFQRRTELKDWMMVYGVGDHGGGPTRRDLRLIEEMTRWPVFPRIIPGRVGEFFRLLERDGARWPEVASELNVEFTGCYTSQSVIKRGNRRGEALCLSAETADAIAGRIAGRAPGDLRESWRKVLFGHFHDILPGSGVTLTREYQSALYQDVQAEAGQIRQQSLAAITAQLDTSFGGTLASSGASNLPAALTGLGTGSGSGRLDGDLSVGSQVGDGPRPMVVVNPSAWERREVVTCTVWDGDGDDDRHPGKRAWTAVLPDGTRLAPQQVGQGRSWSHDFVKLAVPVTVPALGWATVALIEGEPAATPPTTAGASIVRQQDGGHGQVQHRADGSWSLVNEHLSVRIDRVTGGLASIIDRATGAELIAGPCGVLEIIQERPGTMTAWLCGDADAPLPLHIDKVELIEEGPLQVAARVQLSRNATQLTATWRLASGSRQIDLTVEAKWREIGTKDGGVPRLQLSLPTALVEASGRYETPHGAVRRPAEGRVMPAVRWAAVDGKRPQGPGSLVALTQGQHAFDLRPDGTLIVHLLRSSWDPDPLPEVADHVLRLALVPCSALPSDADCLRWAMAHDQPVAVIPATVHPGRLPSSATLLTADDAAVVVVAVRRTSDGLVVRLLNTAAERTSALSVDPLLGRIVAARSADLLQRPQSDLTVTGQQISIALGGFAIATVLITLA
ncbi:hypothetical protein LBMAG53_09530 [Planctomycetota bacterium]|nr:hypothetical protein LBMAG53_09530 [Planctomycetota bacterium]